MPKIERDYRLDPKTGITSETLFWEKGRANFVLGRPDGVASYINVTEAEYKKRQPRHFTYLDEFRDDYSPEDLISFNMGVANGVSSLPVRHIEQELNEIEIIVFKQTLTESTNQETGDLDLEWYFNKLRDEAPEFYDWFLEAGEKIHPPHNFSTYLAGILLSTLPYYMRDDAMELEEKYYPEILNSAA